ncbi:MAG: hypothetical protein AAF828_09435 [Bacteroidota bacterium]
MDISALITEIIAQEGWASGNAMVFTIEGTGLRRADSRNSGEDVAPRLVINLPLPTSVGLQGCEPTRVADGTREFELNVVGTYATGLFDESAAEIVSYDAATQRLFFTNGANNTVEILDISNPASPSLVSSVDMSPYGAGVNSLTVLPGDLVAVAVEAATTDGSGSVVFVQTYGVVGLTLEVGVLPDMITSNADGSIILTANEGEPSDDYMTDPEGSVSIIPYDGVTAGPVTTVDFTAFNDQRESLINKGVRIFGPNATVAQDLEPEYITIADDSIAYVSLQENNAFAIININTAEVLDIVALGYKDHSTGQPKLNEYVLNELVEMPELGTPTYGGGQPPVFLGGFSGLYFDEQESTDELYVFYAVPDRGPNDGAVSAASVTPAAATNLRPFKLPDYQGRIAKFILDITDGEVILDEQILLTRADGTTPITGRGNIPGFDETPVVPADPGLSGTGDLFTDDFEGGDLLNFQTFSVSSNANWEVITTGGYNVAQMNGFGADEASDDWLILPVNLAFITDIFLSFNSIKRFDGGGLRITNFYELRRILTQYSYLDGFFRHGSPLAR